MIRPAILLALLAIALVRFGWGRDRRIAGGGWIVAAIAAIWAVLADGAWGLAVVTLVPVVVALGLLLLAAAASPPRASRTAAEPSVAISGRPDALARRLAVFVLVVPVSFAAAQLAALGLAAAITGTRPLSADPVATAFFAQPLLWTALMAWQMTRPAPRDMVAAPLAVAATGLALWVLA